MKESISVALALFGLMHCAPTHLGATAAESAYTAELLRCVDDSETLSESRACRARVNEHWGISETVTDGGVR
jgi:hypothetical protein